MAAPYRIENSGVVDHASLRRSEKKSLLKKLPLFVRHTFHYDLRSAMMFGIFGGALFPFISIIGRKIGASEFQIAFLMAVPYIANTFALVYTEDLLGKGRVWYVVWPNAVGRAALFGMLFVKTPFQYTLIIFIYMLITAIPNPSYASIMKTNYPDHERGKLMSYIRIGTACLWILSAMIAGWILEKGTENYHYLFPAAALFGILSALEFRHIRIRREGRTRERFASFSNITAPFKNKAFVSFVLAYSLFEFGLLISLPLYPLVQVDKAHIPNFVAGIFGTIFSGAALAGLFFWGRFLDRHALSTSLKLLFFGACGLPLTYILTYNLWFLGASQIIAGFVFVAIDLIGYVITTRMASPKETPRYMAVYIVLGGIRGATAPFLGPVIMNRFGADAAFGIAMLFMVFAAVMVKSRKAID